MPEEEVLISGKHDTLALWGVVALMLLLSVSIAGWSIYEIWRLGCQFVHWILGH